MASAKPGATYRWRGHDAQGKLQQGLLQAPNAALADAQLRRQGIRVEQLRRQWRPHAPTIRPRDITTLTRQWSTLMRAGISLVPALQMLQRSAVAPYLADVLEQVRQDVEGGMPLSQALQRHPEPFNLLYVSMIHAGEKAGILDTMMERLALTLEKNEALRSRVRSALTYPCVVIVVALGVLMLILLHVVPVFEDVFRSFGAELPWSTRAVLTLSRAVQAGALWSALALIPLALFLRRQWQQPAWQRQWHRHVLNMPGVGHLVRTSVLARWAHTLSALLATGVPLAEALPVAGNATGHPIYARINEHLQRRVAQGGRLSEGMTHTGRFPDMLIQLCTTGEETGTLDTLLGKAAELMTDELDTRVNALSSLIEPLIILVLGGAIGVILVAMYLPIFRLGQVF